MKQIDLRIKYFYLINHKSMMPRTTKITPKPPIPIIHLFLRQKESFFILLAYIQILIYMNFDSFSNTIEFGCFFNN